MTLRILKRLVILLLIVTSCTDVVDVEVPEAPPRLVVEASIDWEKGTRGNAQSIRLSTSAPFFSNLEDTSVTGASVRVTNTATNEIFVFSDEGNGLYSTITFDPVLNQTYRLDIDYQGETYSAEETMTSVVAIDALSQSRESGFDNEALGVDIAFNDPPNEENFYFFRFEEEGDLFPELLAIPDEFTDGNRLDVFFEKEEDEDEGIEEFVAGDIVNIKFYGISEQYFNYVDLLIEQFEGGGNPFGTVPASLKGNCINLTNPENYAFGYFRLTEVVCTSYVFE